MDRGSYSRTVLLGQFFGAIKVKKTVLPILIVLLLTTSVFAGNGRKVVRMAQPAYPQLARQMHISGTVKLEATVLPSGKVKDLKVIGGHPVLSDAAMDAAKKWQYEPGSSETVEEISVNFVSQ
jgi:TonB family protein